MRDQHRLGAGTDIVAETLEHYQDQPFPTSDQVLLCSFGLDLDGERSTRQLRLALLAAGFPGAGTGHLIGISPLLRRSSRRSYRLRKFQR